MDENTLKSALEGVDDNKRSTLRRLIAGGAFVTPIVASFAMSGLTVDHAAAQSRDPNATGSGGPPTAASDRRLKTSVARVGTHPAGFGLYRFKYLWSDTEQVGVMAQEVLEVMPDAVTRGDDGFLRVDYAALGIDMVPFATWKAQALAAQPVAAA